MPLVQRFEPEAYAKDALSFAHASGSELPTPMSNASALEAEPVLDADDVLVPHVASQGAAVADV
jgi:hypothetical protein